MGSPETGFQAKVIRAFNPAAEAAGFKLTGFHIYRENTVRSLVGDGEPAFPEVTSDSPLPVGKVHVEAHFEEIATERRVIVTIPTSVREGGTIQHCPVWEISYIDTIEGDAGPGGEVPDSKFSKVTSALPGLCQGVISMANAVINLGE
ncbi:MAG: hypothetical protein L3K17_03735 [Thermoplasmata archaeon]|nr:hypothetical protein [Thermoplasmata archaeon]